ncbi:MAG: SIR2 family NAD-dependent protein deacylase [Sulfuricella sp.]
MVELYARAARLIAAADGLLITAGAGMGMGMGIDSGLPDFRGPQGFWKEYPALGRAGIRFEQIARPVSLRATHELAWGFYGHRLNLYREAMPHPGFGVLLNIAALLPAGGFVFTSNVDGQFQKAGFAEERVAECHGSIHHLQCLDQCNDAIWSAASFVPTVNDETGLLESLPPTCPACGGLARPNILMFGDDGWASSRSEGQQARLDYWLGKPERPVVIELGAGTYIPTVRLFGENLSCPISVRATGRRGAKCQPAGRSFGRGEWDCGCAGVKFERLNPPA